MQVGLSPVLPHPSLELTMEEAVTQWPSHRQTGLRDLEHPSATDIGAAAVVRLIERQLALVKTVKNSDWLMLLKNMSNRAFRSSFTLPPPSGRMHLYGGAGAQGVGLIVDRRELDMTHSVCFPSGYFAKTEFHLHVEASGAIQLTGGRAGHLTTIEAIAESQLQQHEERAHEQPGFEPPLYNEINLTVRGTAGLCAVFVRSHTAEDTRFAMSVRDLLQHLNPQLPPLPLLRMTPADGVAIVTHREQLCVLRGAQEASVCRSLDAQPRLPLDALSFPELALGECLALHCAHGITRGSLHATLEAIGQMSLGDRSFGGTERLAPHVARCLCAAALVDNVASAREIVRTAAPIMLRPLLVSNGEGDVSVASRAAKAAVAAATLPPKPKRLIELHHEEQPLLTAVSDDDVVTAGTSPMTSPISSPRSPRSSPRDRARDGSKCSPRSPRRPPRGPTRRWRCGARATRRPPARATRTTTTCTTTWTRAATLGHSPRRGRPWPARPRPAREERRTSGA